MNDPDRVEGNEQYTTRQREEWAQARNRLVENSYRYISPQLIATLFADLQSERCTSQQLSGISHLCHRLADHLDRNPHTPSHEPSCQSCGCSRLPVESREPYEWTGEDEDLFTLVESLLGPLSGRAAPMPDPMIKGDPILEEFWLDSKIVWIYNHLLTNGEGVLAIRYWHYAKELPYFPQDWES